MTQERPPGHISVHDDLESARPLTKQEFVKVKSGKRDVEDLSEKEQEFYESVKELAKSIKNDRQLYPVTARQHQDGDLELITGYRRYLACVYIGCPVKYEIKSYTDDEILKLIYNENENREDLNPYDRAVIIAKKMGRWDDEDGFIPECEAQDGMTIAEFAEDTGKNRGLIYQQLSPLRQNKKMRDEFDEAICESSFQLIEQIAKNKAQQYTLAQALSRSHIDTHSKFQASYKLAKQSASTNEELVQEVCRKLIGLEHTDVKGSYVPPEEQVPDSVQRIEDYEEQQKQQEEQEAQEIQKQLENGDIGQRVPEPDEPGSGPDIKVNNATNGSGERIEHGMSGNAENGTSVLPGKNNQPFDDAPLDLTLPEGDVSQLIREQSHEREMDPGELVTEIVEVHFRREGMLTDTPGATVVSDD